MFPFNPDAEVPEDSVMDEFDAQVEEDSEERIRLRAELDTLNEEFHSHLKHLDTGLDDEALLD